MSSGAKSCWACAGPLRPWLRARDFNRGLSDEWFSYSRCVRCGSGFIDRIPGDLGRYYPTDYYSVPTSYDAFARGLEPERYRIDLLLPHVSRGRLLEIGPGNGIFTHFALEAGFEVAAIEYDADCCRFMREHQKIEAICSGEPHAVPIEAASFDAVALWHSLEHIPSAVPTLRAAARWLRPGGVLLIAVPNPEALGLRVLGRWWPHLDAPRHLCFFTLAALERLLAAEGLTLERATTSDPGGRHWNRFAWEYAARNLCRARRKSARFERRAIRIAGWWSRLLKPFETSGLRGATYTAIFRKASGARGSG